MSPAPALRAQAARLALALRRIAEHRGEAPAPDTALFLAFYGAVVAPCATEHKEEPCS